MIEEYLDAHGISKPWYKVYHTSLFMQILEIYEKNVNVVEEDVDMNEEEILAGLHLLYEQVVKEVSLNVDKILEGKIGSTNE